MFALCIKIGFFEDEGISADMRSAALLLIQLVPVLVCAGVSVVVCMQRDAIVKLRERAGQSSLRVSRRLAQQLAEQARMEVSTLCAGPHSITLLSHKAADGSQHQLIAMNLQRDSEQNDHGCPVHLQLPLCKYRLR